MTTAIEQATQDQREAVERGANWLDENQPEWLDEINLDALNMMATHGCVLGQVYGSVGYAPNQVTGDDMSFYGFNPVTSFFHDEDGNWTDVGTQQSSFEVSQKIWTELVEERRSK